MLVGTWAAYARQSYRQQWADGVRWKRGLVLRARPVRALMRPGRVRVLRVPG